MTSEGVAPSSGFAVSAATSVTLASAVGPTVETPSHAATPAKTRAHRKRAGTSRTERKEGCVIMVRWLLRAAMDAALTRRDHGHNANLCIVRERVE